MKMSAEEMKAMGMTMDPEVLAEQEPFDKGFIDNMIPHHESAIAMANVALEAARTPRYGDRPRHRGRPRAGDRADAGLAKRVVPGA